MKRKRKFLPRRKKISTEEEISGYRRENFRLPKKKFPAIEEKISGYRRRNFRLSKRKFSAVEGEKFCRYNLIFGQERLL
jgi:hypothetical protein